MSTEESIILKKGIWRYDNIKECDVWVYKSNVIYGSGDYEDEPDIRDNKWVECYNYCVGSTAGKSESCPHGGCYMTLQETINQVEILLGNKLRWIS